MRKMYLALLALCLALPLALPAGATQPVQAPAPANSIPWSRLSLTTVILPTTTAAAATRPAASPTSTPAGRPISPTHVAATGVPSRQPVSPGATATRRPAAPATPVSPARPPITGTLPATRTVEGAADSAADSAVAYGFQGVLEGIYQTVSPSVVHISILPSAEIKKAGQGDMLILPMLPGQSQPAPRAVEGPPSAIVEGSGFVWDNEGHIVTNAHVVEKDLGRIYVTFADGLTLPAAVTGTDAASDLAVLKVDEREADFHPIVMGDSTRARVGQLAIVVGHPLGLRSSMNLGIISGLGRSIPLSLPDENAPLWAANEIEADMIQIDTPVSWGNSGGVLVDLAGRLIGVPSNGDIRGEDLNYAIPSAIVQRVVPALIETGTYEHPWIGINTMPLTPDFALAMGLPESQQGALVMDVTVNSPADTAGVRGSSKRATIEGEDFRLGGDLVVALDGHAIHRPEEIESILSSQLSVGQAISLTVVRNGEALDLPLEVAARPEPPAPEKLGEVGGNAWLGLNGVTLSAELARAMNLPAETRGVLIESVVTGSPADQAGLRGGYRAHAVAGEWLMIGGDVITSVSSQPVRGMDDLLRLTRQMKPGRPVTITILRDGKEMSIEVTPAGRPDQTL